MTFIKKNLPWGLITSIAMFLMAFCYAMFQGGFVSWFLFYSYLPVFVYAILLGMYPLNRLQVERKIDLDDELQAGDKLWVELTVTRSFPFPLIYLGIEDGVPEQIRLKGQVGQLYKGLFQLHFRRKLVFYYEISTVPRGEHYYEHVILKTGDLFGIIQKSATIPCESTFTIYPKLRALSSWQPLDHAAGGTSRARKPFEMDLTSISSVRDYTAGDRLSWLDWKATARSNKLVTKQFDFPVNRDVLFILDATSHGHLSDQAFERSISLTASLAKRAIDTGAGVGLLTIHENRKFIQVDGGMNQQWLIMKHLSMIDPKGSTHPATILHSYLNAISQQMTCLYIGQSLDEKLVSLFSECLYRGFEVELFIVKEIDDMTALEQGYLESFKRQGVKGHIMPNDDFDYALRVGGHRATI